MLQVDPGANKVVQPYRGRQRAALAGRRRRRGVGRVGRRRAHPPDRSRPAGASAPVDPGRREPERDRGRRRRALGGERGGRDGDADRAAHGQRRARDPRRATGRARSRSARARCGSSTATTGRCRGSIPATNSVSWSVRGGRRPDRGRGGRGRGVGRGRRGGDRRTRRPRRAARGEAAQGREQPDRDRRRRRLGVGGRGRPAGRAPRRDAARARPVRAGRCDPDRLAALARVHHLVDRRSSARWPTTASSRTGASRAPPAPRSSARSPRPHPRRAPTAGPTSSRCGAGCATPTAARSRPTDFRASMERFLLATRGLPPGRRSRRCTPASSARGGACGRGRVRPLARDRDRTCRRARSPSTSRARTRISCTSSRCSSPSSCRPTARAAPRAGLTPPGTGPYRVAAWDSQRGGTSSATATSGRARRARAGRASRTASRSASHDKETTERQIAAVQRGDADVAVLADPFAARSSRSAPASAGGALARAGCTAPRRPTTDWMFLNVRRRPFDDLGVRRAINFAIDRAQASSSSREGRRSAQPTCQIVPAGFPGYSPYCPYTARPRGGRGWTAPDMEQRAPARGGVRAGGRARDHLGAGLPGGVGRYFAKAARRARLPRLGAGAGLRRHDIFGPTRADWASPAGGPTTSARRRSSRPTFACPRGAPTTSRGSATRSCERLIDRAAVAPPRGCRAAPGPPPTAASSTSPPAVPLTSRRVGRARLQASGQRQDARAVVHAAGPDVGALSWRLARRTADR